jgi:hypothetical protein
LVEYISVTQDVRELASSVISAQFPDGEIVEEQKAAYGVIAVWTHKNDWDNNDFEFVALQKIEAQLAKAYIMEHYGGPTYNNVVQSTYDNIFGTTAKKGQLDKIIENMQTTVDDTEESVTRTDYQSPNLNPDAEWSSKLSQSLRSDIIGNLE